MKVAYVNNGYTTEYQIKSSWENDQSINVKITNTGKEPIVNWVVKYDTDGIVKELSNAVIHSRERSMKKLRRSLPYMHYWEICIHLIIKRHTILYQGGRNERIFRLL